MAEPPPNGGEGDTPRSAHDGLVQFAAAAKAAIAGGNAGGLPELSAGNVPIPEDLESLICDVAKTGSVNSYPWDALRLLLARKVELVLGEFWRDAPDVEVQEGESFERAAVEPLMRSLLEPRREGPPFTVQRICELLSEPRLVYKSTRRYLYALQRAVLVTATEEVLAQQQQQRQPQLWQMPPLPDGGGISAAPPSPTGASLDSTVAAATGASNGAGKKRKLSPELSNGIVSEETSR
mmetsp:Transcript_38173/g.105224  ORF Transcript_38173/g.105224 Transcript_38173/m.105224 type:complete len:237 (-) Transcript_38173:185-895(-)|eukprot:CAMPEP_0117497246 /NCGR_PEP_ID=MMETSP0784-20121206/21082_1 /TAXON_ID=39447 /ORGANISM="" /LENGTH=236 /DNA_ID=CAMNT_0005292259 /DNA_START=88 /DNA_END=798 /DNA_ORIENTATION=-